jgi:maltooligosyltrehalose trehalohydrolase
VPPRKNDISVWAPEANVVEVDLGNTKVPMDRSTTGWWFGVLPPGVRDYAFVVDGGPPLPDPRSGWQPNGVHGRSRLVNHGEFQWTDQGWQAPPLSAAVVYELHIGTFTEEGTFDAAIRRIPYLLELGVTHVELMPVNEFPGDWGWGYDGVDLYAPQHAYGGPEGLKRLVDALHANGLAAILDVVYNHLGPSGNYLGQYGPYFTSSVQTPWGPAVNLGGSGSGEVRRFFIDNALMWLRDYHFDGLRLDAVHALVDASAVHFLEELAAAVKELEAELGRHLILIAESDLNDPRVIRSPEAGGYGFDAQWSDDFHHALHTVLTGERSGYYRDFGSLRHIAKALQDGFVYDGCHSEARGRVHGRPLTGIPKNRLLGYLQTHDQIGNRARGERIAALAGFDRAKIGAALYLLGPFVPMIFQGEEWGASSPFQYFTKHEDEELGHKVSEGRRSEFAEFGWSPAEVPDPQDPATFHRSKLRWDDLHRAPHSEMLEWYRELLRLRKQPPALRSADVRVSCDESTGAFAMDRRGIAVLCNFGSEPLSVPARRGARLLLRSRDSVELRGDRVVLPPESVAILGPAESREALELPVRIEPVPVPVPVNA